MFFWNDEVVNGGFWIDVFDDKNVLRFSNDGCGKLLGNDFAKDTVFVVHTTTSMGFD